MSCLIPAALVKSLRQQQSVSLDAMGVDCTLYTANNNTAIQSLDAYATNTTDLTFTSVITKVFINWKPDIYKLRKLGLFTEGSAPIVAEFKYDKIIPIGSYFSFTVSYPNGTATDSTDSDDFEIVNSYVGGMLDAVIFPTYLIAPRRKQ
jgi:hypothetical protein